MSKIDYMRKKLELQKVECAASEMEFKILEREEDIKRLKENLEIQNNKITQLKEELKDLKE